MPKIKIPRKSTRVDMTAMCDVAFLLLTFFMLATRFKPDGPLEIIPPSSTAQAEVPDRGAFEVFFDKGGRVFFSCTDADLSERLVDYVNSNGHLGLTAAERSQFLRLCRGAGVGEPIAGIPEALSPLSLAQPGIPALDSAHNQLRPWVAALLAANGGRAPDNILIDGDQSSRYPSFREVLRAFTDNNVFHFKLITSMASADEPLNQ